MSAELIALIGQIRERWNPIHAPAEQIPEDVEPRLLPDHQKFWRVLEVCETRDDPVDGRFPYYYSAESHFFKLEPLPVAIPGATLKLYYVKYDSVKNILYISEHV